MTLFLAKTCFITRRGNCLLRHKRGYSCAISLFATQPEANRIFGDSRVISGPSLSLEEGRGRGQVLVDPEEGEKEEEGDRGWKREGRD